MININMKSFSVPQKFTMLVSSGVDSIAAAHWLKYKFRRNFSVIHFNHNVQDCNQDMLESTMRFCDDHDLSFDLIVRGDSYTDKSENALRQWRLEWLSRFGGNFVTAHHLNDCVEEYVKHCMEGTPEHMPIRYVSMFDNATIYHPFLTTTKKDFIKYAEQNNLMQYVVEDPTNKENHNMRNWLRNVIIPEMMTRTNLESVVRRKFFPQVKN